jgi:hypothetical protein
LLNSIPPSAKYRPFISWTGKKIGAAEVARAASQTRQSSELGQGRLQIQTASDLKSEYLVSRCSRQMTALDDCQIHCSLLTAI